MRWHFPVLLLLLMLTSSHAEAPCRIKEGEVVGIRDPRLHDPECFIEAGVTIRLSVVEVTPRIRKARIERHLSCTPAPNEAALMADLVQKAQNYVTERGGDEAIIEVVEGVCWPSRSVDLEVVEVQ